MSEEELYHAVMWCLASNKRKAFEALKQMLKAARAKWNNTVKWYNWVCVPRSMKKWRAITEMERRCVYSHRSSKCGWVTTRRRASSGCGNQR